MNLHQIDYFWILSFIYSFSSEFLNYLTYQKNRLGTIFISKKSDEKRVEIYGEFISEVF